MSSSENQPRDQRLQEVIASYLEKTSSGQDVDRVQFLAEHPDLADDLRAFFADDDQMKQAAAAVRTALKSQASDVREIFPQRFGDYELLEEVGRGGMGSFTGRGRSVSIASLP